MACLKGMRKDRSGKYDRKDASDSVKVIQHITYSVFDNECMNNRHNYLQTSVAPA